MTSRDYTFDVIVIGGGHAGVEAAAAACRVGARTALVTHHWVSVGAMSCNPAIGGIGKGHLVREVDALDGVMGIAADFASIQYRVLNRRKGPAVQGLRAQIDRRLYAGFIQSYLEKLANLTVIEGGVERLLSSSGKVTGVALEDGSIIDAASVVLTTGTFLRGLIHVGHEQTPGGRFGEQPAKGLSQSLLDLGLRLGRLKTGTPARLDGRTINYAGLDAQPADDDPFFFSYQTKRVQQPQVCCHITKTTGLTHRIINDNLGLSAMYSGNIEGVGPRYCPSIEDKVVRFGERDGHQIFLEPEGLDSTLVYPNGISTSLPAHVQDAFIRSIPGLEAVDIVRYGYAIEYDHIDPMQLNAALGCKTISGLYFAGQINGTTGYEEAAGQGLVAGMNAARAALGLENWVSDRTSSYIGVMIDDLITKGVSEPYRMFTSRAEYRLSLRNDNADVRLTPAGIRFGCVSNDRAASYQSKVSRLDAVRARLQALSLSPTEAHKFGIIINQDGLRRTAWQLLARNEITTSLLTVIWPELFDIDISDFNQIAIEAMYYVYVDRQNIEIERVRNNINIKLPENMAYLSIDGLSTELRQKLQKLQPANLQQAMAVEGMTPAAGTLLLALTKKQGQAGA